MKLVEVDAQRHRDDVRSVDAVELLARECRRADDGVVVRGCSAVGLVGDHARQPPWKELSDKAIKALVRDHHGGDGRACGPTGPAIAM